MTFQEAVAIAYVAYLVVMSLIAFCLYGKDKKMSKAGTEVRIKEKTLLSFTVFGGGVGAFFARITFRHKTKKIYFSLTVYLSLVLQLAVLALVLGLML